MAIKTIPIGIWRVLKRAARRQRAAVGTGLKSLSR
jgi:hypothetical protein